MNYCNHLVEKTSKEHRVGLSSLRWSQIPYLNYCFSPLIKSVIEQ